ncbi:MAG TPA: flagellar basal body L-ring protein FlgH [Marinagarivorans sp.]
MIYQTLGCITVFLRKTILMAGLTLVGVGCASQPTPMPGDPHYAPVVMPAAPPVPATNGSLFSEHSAMQLFADQKANRIGDLVTVVLSEQTVSNKSANVGVSKDANIALPSPTVFGAPVTIGGNTLASGVSAERDFSGNADAGQSNSLRGNITVTVMDVWPNGTLVVRGEKWMTLNRGSELIRISGLVRPDDVSSDNEVLSTKIANAQITYTGTGELAASQAMGFMSRFFNSGYWPF